MDDDFSVSQDIGVFALDFWVDGLSKEDCVGV